jgi:predicted MFS family arabinose efflux permease
MRAFYRDSLLAVGVGTATVMPGFLVGALSLQIKNDLDASLTVVAAGVTVFFAAGAIAAGPVGRVTERVGALTSMRAATVATSIALIAIAVLARSLPVLFALLVVCGVANGTAQPAINLFMAEEVDLTRQGFAFGVKQSAIPAATTIAGLSLPLLALPLGWRNTVAICAGLVLMVAVATRWRAALGRVAAGARSAAGKERLKLSPPLLLLAVGAACSSFAPGALAAYLVASAVDTGIPEGAAGVGLALGSAASFVARISLGIRADRRKDYGFTVIVALLAGGSIGFVLLATGGEAPFMIGAFVAFTLGWGWPGLFNLAVVEKYRATPAAATGVTQAGIYVGAASGPAVFGVVSSAIGYSAAWAATAGVLLMAATVIWIAQSWFGKTQTGTTETGAEAGIRHI